MAQFDILDVERHAAAFTRNVDDLIRIDEKDARVRVKKAADQPGARDAVDLRAPPGDPNAWPAWRNSFELGFGDKRKASFRPALVAAFQDTRVDVISTQLRDRGLAHFVTGFAGYSNRALRIEIAFPLAGSSCVAPDRAWQQVGRLLIRVAPSHVDELWCIARCNRIPKIFGRD